MRLWKDKSGPCMQVLHFAFAFGAFLAPIIAKGFISEDLESDDENSTFCVGTRQEQGSGTMIINSTMLDDNGSRFRIAYWISSAIFLPTLLAYIFYAVKYNIITCCRKKSTVNKVIVNPSHDADSLDDKEEDNEIEPYKAADGRQSLIFRDDTEIEDFEDASSSTPSGGKDKTPPISTKSDRLFKVIILFLLGTFMFVYVGLEVALWKLDIYRSCQRCPELLQN